MNGVLTEVRGKFGNKRSRDWNDESMTQGIPRTPEPRRKAAKDRFSFRATRRSQPCQHLDFGLLASRHMSGKVSVVLASQLIVIC